MKASRSPNSDVRTTPGASPATCGRALLDAHLDLILRKLRVVSRHGGLPAVEAEDFRSWALVKLIDNDCRILRKWEGRSTISTYLTVVLTNLLRDYRDHLWGKCRRSKTPRHRRRMVSESELLELAVDGQVECRVEEQERASTANRLRDLLVQTLPSLPAEERLVLKLYFFEGLSMAAVAPILGRPQRELFLVRDRCLKKLRRAFHEGGLGSSQIRGVIGHFQGNFDVKALLVG